MALGPVMLDVDGPALSPADRDLLREPAVGGVILFSRNYRSPAQLSDLVASIRALRSPALLVAADYEGGRVQRFREEFTAIPPHGDSSATPVRTAIRSGRSRSPRLAAG
ncbi:MAG: glycoside hydrolase family 3 N-terminal domain-containing protein [Woeseiaceae bacterium]|nr:glycoside hydrolase family 3 N-terminal domain-containing protein [Woeseiaceae bacterium]